MKGTWVNPRKSLSRKVAEKAGWRFSVFKKSRFRRQRLAFERAQLLLPAQESIPVPFGGLRLVDALHQRGQLAVNKLIAQPQRNIREMLRRIGQPTIYRLSFCHQVLLFRGPALCEKCGQVAPSLIRVRGLLSLLTSSAGVN